MITVNFTNEKGSVAVKVRAMCKDQVMAKLEKGLMSQFEDVGENAKGGYSIPIATDRRTGETVYAHIAVTISTSDPNEKKTKSGGKATKTPEENFDLFTE